MARRETFDDLDRHRLIAYGEEPAVPVASLNWVLTAGRGEDDARRRARRA